MSPLDARKRVRIAIVEDEPLFRDLLRRVCLSCEEIEVWGDLGSGEALIEAMDEVMRRSEEAPVDVLLTDIALGSNLNGFQISHRLRESHPNLGVLLLSN